ncbi:PBCV-specific basic adaptor domain-containing protein [Chloriridovirus anopheles1]|uniref:PBCV-specific basic adaptor domain-containing protein n=1 Tax=Chloriridovirus anopheles1 TaxID=1465751 RepID=W8QE80_9VIRU|nr:PBCV-specific basic adaptor domain-containing protein [Anopheles minimus iridovirus]AHL67610.1 PBCV-specific basic adaptor domain-containing protein [Anopheles minimus iridovirus]
MSECTEWRNNPSINPLTNRYIKKGGKVYKQLEDKCGLPHTARKPNLVR